MSGYFLDLQQLTRKYGEQTALHELTLQLPPGIVGLLGPNGAGKSTLLKILLGLIPPTSGSGRVFDQPFDHKDSNWKLRQIIGFMPENDALVLGLTGIEYVTLAGQLYGMSGRQAARRSHEVLTYLELEEARYRKVEQYSAGMKQRVKLAQALVHDPPVLLLDEPTSGLDPAGRDKMLKLIAELANNHGKSIILSTHLLADVEAVCQRVVILAEGKLRGVGTVKELCTTRKERYRLKLSGDVAKYRQELEFRNVRVAPGDDSLGLVVTIPEGWSNRTFFEIALQCDVVLRGVMNEDESLEEIFVKKVSGK